MRKEKYELLEKQIHALVADEADWMANLANAAAAIQHTFGWHWVGFYRVNNNELVLGPFQGPVACTRIGFGKGVCGKAWETGQTQVVADVHQFPGHIACSAESNSEIVVPLVRDGKVVAVLDIDSTTFDDFDQHDATALEKIVAALVA